MQTFLLFLSSWIFDFIATDAYQEKNVEKAEKATSLWCATGCLVYSNSYNCCATEKSFYCDLLILSSN